MLIYVSVLALCCEVHFKSLSFTLLNYDGSIKMLYFEEGLIYKS